MLSLSIYFSYTRDREHQILNIEEERHRYREKEHGKNYLLETYLNGLHEFTGTSSGVAAAAAGTSSDSGVHTSEDANSSPTTTPIDTASHQQAADTISAAPPILPSNSHGESSSDAAAATTEIEWLQKVCAINKQLQREEERWVRLSRSLHKYESKDSVNKLQTAAAMNAELDRLATQIECRTTEIDRIQQEIDVTGELMNVKTDVLARLSTELQQLEVESNNETASPLPIDSQSTTYYSSDSAAAAVRMISHQGPIYWQKKDCEIASINLLHQQNGTSLMATMPMSKVGPKKLQLHNFHAKDPDSDTGLSSLGEDSVLLGTLV